MIHDSATLSNQEKEKATPPTVFTISVSAQIHEAENTACVCGHAQRCEHLQVRAHEHAGPSARHRTDTATSLNLHVQRPSKHEKFYPSTSTASA